MKINEQWEELKEASNANIQSEKGILKRQIRSIQTEGHFGDIKENGAENSLKNGANPKIRTKGALRPKIGCHQKKKVIPQESELQQSLNPAGLFHFLVSVVKKRYFPAALSYKEK